MSTLTLADLGEALTEARKSHWQKQGETAEIIGVSQVSLSHYESGKNHIPAMTMRRLCAELCWSEESMFLRAQEIADLRVAVEEFKKDFLEKKADAFLKKKAAK